MNILDVKDSDLGITGEDKLDQIFRRQLELMKLYEHIEADNGLQITADIPVNLHDKMGQYRLKDFAWRITEELGEAMEALRIHPEIPEHFEEEIADALHFLVEFTILSGMNMDWLTFTDVDKLEWAFNLVGGQVPVAPPNHDTLLPRMALIVEYLSITCNCLKNKPWKITQMMTDTSYFYIRLQKTWLAFFILCHHARIDAESLTNLYFKKSEVNKFRQRTNY